MRRALCFILLLLPAMVIAATKPVLNIQRWKTKNGAEVFFVRAPELPMLNLRVIFAAGSAYDGQQFGLASLSNAMFAEGTKTMNADQIAQAFDKVGAVVNNSVNRDWATESLKTLTQLKYMQPALATFKKVLTEATFPEGAFARIKNQTKTLIRYEHQRPTMVAKRLFYENAYANEPYGHSVYGTQASLKTITLQMVQGFYRRHYVGSNADLIIVGDVTRAQAEKIADETVGALPKGAPARELSNAKDLTAAQTLHKEFSAQQTTIWMGQVGINRQSPDYFPLMVGNFILGGSSSSSLLYQSVRNQYGLAYYAFSNFAPLRYRGPFLIRLQTKAAQTHQALQVVDKTLDGFIKNGPTNKELSAAKKNIIGAFPLLLASNKNLIRVLSAIAFYHLPLNYLDTYRNNVSTVTASSIQKAFAKHLRLHKMLLVTVGPK